MDNTTTVCNVRVKYIRPKYDNLKVWCEDKDNVYIGRGGVVFVSDDTGKKRFPSKNSVFCNPYKVTKTCSREESILLFEKYIREKIKNDRDFIDKLLELKGKNLGCWCKPEACHGDILVRLIDEFS